MGQFSPFTLGSVDWIQAIRMVASTFTPWDTSTALWCFKKDPLTVPLRKNKTKQTLGGITSTKEALAILQLRSRTRNYPEFSIKGQLFTVSHSHCGSKVGWSRLAGVSGLGGTGKADNDLRFQPEAGKSVSKMPHSQGCWQKSQCFLLGPLRGTCVSSGQSTCFSREVVQKSKRATSHSTFCDLVSEGIST